MADTMVSTREVPWMKLGKIVPTMDLQEAMRAGGLDFTVSARDVAFAPEGAHDGSGWTEAPRRKFIVADDDETPFDVVSADYPIVQYSEALDVMASVGPTAVAAGTLNGRKQGFLVMELAGGRELSLLDGDDPHELYMVMRTSHDRSRAVEFACMPLRGRCMNQLTLASFTQGAKQRWSFPHVGDVHAKMRQAEQSVLNFAAYARSLDELATRLDAIAVETERATDVLRRVLPDKPTRDEKVTSILGLWRDSETVGYPTTGWGLVNAVSEFYDWGRVGGSPASRFAASLAGQTKNAIDRTASLLLSRVN